MDLIPLLERRLPLSTRRNKFLMMSGAAPTAGLLALSGCSSTPGGDNPPTPALPATEISGTVPEPSVAVPPATSGVPTPAPSESSGISNANPIPHNALEYADALVRAWGAGDRDRMAQLAKSGVLEVLDQYGKVGGPHWGQSGHDAGAGSVFVSYVNTKDGKKLEMRVENEAAPNGQAHAVAEAKFDN
ncbi:hypothetical protein [Paeniglutamicibacter sp. NPDC091659]|uniref:hypothetical protein n=1 Tax=Paeniglutamicibacter sp. NPDC091659 TaxID=3364389 RepID=UPI0038090B9D